MKKTEYIAPAIDLTVLCAESIICASVEGFDRNDDSEEWFF